jgi:uncharacterized protein (TIGR03085 family)
VSAITEGHRSEAVPDRVPGSRPGSRRIAPDRGPSAADYDSAVTHYARSERAALADALHAAGPDAPTLCDGWTTRDLAAHVVLREREPVAAAGIIVKPLSGYLGRRQKQRAATEYEELLGKLRRPPAWSLVSNPLTDEGANVLEMYVHHEDVRRAQPKWRPRALDPGLEEALWKRIGRTARFALRRFPAAVALEWPGHGTVAAGAGGPEVRLQGRPGELVMFLTGRQGVADVTLTGPDEVVERLRRARLGI